MWDVKVILVGITAVVLCNFSGGFLARTQKSNHHIRRFNTKSFTTLGDTDLESIDATIDNGDGSNDADELGPTSVHLKLTKLFDHNDLSFKEDNNTEKNTSVFEIVEMYRLSTNESLVSCSTESIQSLPYFYCHTFNVTANDLKLDDIGTRKRSFDIDANTTSKDLQDLWRSEKYLATGKDFPYNVLRKKQKEKVADTVASHVSRIQRIRRECAQTDIPLLGFLKAQNISGLPWTDYQFAASAEETVTLTSLKKFLVWFRDEFPYYYDACLHCGNSVNNSYYGVVYPTEDERSHQAGVVELYLCGNEQCASTSRFARFNSVLKMLQTRRGRCGEYSVLVMRMLLLLGYQARWTVDWADHVWAEVRIGGRWVHVDPCEAAVDEPLIYQGWGKKQTYVVAYSFTEAEDVTSKYTTDSDGIVERRSKDGESLESIAEVLEAATIQLNELSTSDQAVGSLKPTRKKRVKEPVVADGVLKPSERAQRKPTLKPRKNNNSKNDDSHNTASPPDGEVGIRQ
jgi:hypothetical protein